ncbi:MAG: (Fe-S)-binding protein [Chloroflexi bacterium]|jgi:Fe-S oxidoreductase|nr:(Fe-S)-binding protein [Chloroflexota bacterium]
MNPSDLDVIVDYAATDFVEKCINCGECLRACPIFPLTKYADIGPEAMIEKVVELLKGGEISDEAYDMVWSCSGGCNRCVQACPQGLWLNAALLVFARAKMFRAGKELPYEMDVLMAEKRSRMGNDLPALQFTSSEQFIKIASNTEGIRPLITGC